jgi:molybdenum cofactor cytidylyltransferase
MIAALVPAAGSSARLGQPKLLLGFGGQTLIGRVIRSLRDGGAQRVVVVAPPADAAEGPPIADEARLAGAEVVVPVTRPAEMRDSIELGLKTLAKGDLPDHLLLTPGDHPGLTAELVSQIVERAVNTPDRLVIPTYNGRRGHPIAIPWKIAICVHDLPAGAGFNALVAQYSDKVAELTLPHAEILADLDTPEDLGRYRERPGSFRVRVRLFAIAKDRAGQSEVEIELQPGSTVADLRATMILRTPALAPLLAAVMIAIDEEYADDDVPIRPGSRVAVIPPVSGGAGEPARPRHSQSKGVSPR